MQVAVGVRQNEICANSPQPFFWQPSGFNAPTLHAAGTAGMLFLSRLRRKPPGEGQRQRDAENERQISRETAAGFSQALLPLCATNDILERFVWSCVVSVKCVCYIQAQDPGVNRETYN